MSDLPPSIPKRRAWRSADFASSADWVTPLGAEARADLGAAADRLPADASKWLAEGATSAISARLASRLGDVADELANGRGYALLRAERPELDPGRLRAMFWLVGNALGRPISQNARGQVLTQVIDRFAGQPRGVDTRGYESNDELRFHTDGGDVIGLACVRQAPAGGCNGLVSMLAIYNEFRERQPEHLETLLRGFPIYMRKEAGDTASTRSLGKVQERRMPVFAWEQEHASAWLNFRLTELAAEVSGNAFSPAEQAALEAFEEIAERPDMKLSFQMEPGDMLWINNFAVMHRRDAYEDDPDPAKQRMLFRMWLNLHLAPPIAPALAGIRRGFAGPAPSIEAVEALA